MCNGGEHITGQPNHAPYIIWDDNDPECQSKVVRADNDAFPIISLIIQKNSEGSALG
jgi:hypothetical protein